MGYLVDTSILIEIENNNHRIIEEIEKLRHSAETNLFISIFNFCEIYYGAINKNEKNKSKTVERLNEYDLLNTTQKTGKIFCELLCELKKAGKLIPYFDLFIAAIAVENNLTLITEDNHFRNISRLHQVILTI
ncbi:MAG: type II toxin-antitoxin system VapC family toxin [Nanoarchaeota archaeon]|nr:type II toxin-antitoxin system VapC family toxin [Nanoarchaeota archaeon]